jgi:hypothetical protein
VTGAPFDRADQFGEVDIDLLADYVGGALTGTPDESAVAARIADDPVWQSAYTALSEGMTFVTTELSRLTPEPMPADLAAHLDALFTGPPADLAAPTNAVSTDAVPTNAAPTDAASTDAGGDDTIDAARTDFDFSDVRVSSVTTGESVPTDFRRVESGADLGDRAGADDEIASAEPIAPELAAPTVPHLKLVRGGIADGETTSSVVDGDGAEGVRKTQPAPRRGRRLRWVAPIAVAAGLVAFVGFGLDYLAGRDRPTSSADSAAGLSDDSGRGSAAKVAGGEPTLASGTNYTHATLGIAPMQPMTAPLSSPGRKTTPEFSSGIEPALQRLAVPSTLADCLAAIQQANGADGFAVQSVDYARFGGAPAVIVRFTAANGQWAWASGPDCGTPAAGAATLDKVPVG